MFQAAIGYLASINSATVQPLNKTCMFSCLPFDYLSLSSSDIRSDSRHSQSLNLQGMKMSAFIHVSSANNLCTGIILFSEYR